METTQQARYSKHNNMEKDTETEKAPGAHDVIKLEVPEVTWWRHAGLVRLYSMLPILFVASTIKGYDGSLLNGLQTMEPWRDCKSCYLQ